MRTYPAGHLLCIRQCNYEHVGISDGNGGVFENSYSRGGRGLVSLEVFANGQSIKDLGPMDHSVDSEKVVEQARMLIGRSEPYHIMQNNCEHFVRQAYGKLAASPQIQKSYLFLIAGVMLSNSTGSFSAGCALWLGGWIFGVRRWTWASYGRRFISYRKVAVQSES